MQPPHEPYVLIGILRRRAGVAAVRVKSAALTLSTRATALLRILAMVRRESRAERRMLRLLLTNT